MDNRGRKGCGGRVRDFPTTDSHDGKRFLVSVPPSPEMMKKDRKRAVGPFSGRFCAECGPSDNISTILYPLLKIFR